MPVAPSWHAARLALTWPNRLVRCYRFCCARAMGEWSWHAAKLVLTELEGRFREACSCCARWNEVASDPFPPLAKGVRGGGPGTTGHKVFPCSLPLSASASLLRGGKSRFRSPRLAHQIATCSGRQNREMSSR